MKSRIFRHASLAASLFLLVAVPTQASPIRFADVVNVMGPGKRRPNQPTSIAGHTGSLSAFECPKLVFPIVSRCRLIVYQRQHRGGLERTGWYRELECFIGCRYGFGAPDPAGQCAGF